jgi:GABA(A) receptor-associated protein
MSTINMDTIDTLKCSFKKSKTHDERCKESVKIKEKYPDRIPVIVEKSEKCTLVHDIDKQKYLVPMTLSCSQFLYIIRKRIRVSDSEALFIFINCNLVPSSKTMGEIYSSEKDTDGFLYVTYTNENTFG